MARNFISTFDVCLQENMATTYLASNLFNDITDKSKSFGKFIVYFKDMTYIRRGEVPNYEVARNYLMKIYF